MLHAFLSNLGMTYGWRSATVVANMLDQAQYNPFRYFGQRRVMRVSCGDPLVWAAVCLLIWSG
jgi:hypothetical protein